MATCTSGLAEPIAGRVRANQLRSLFRLNALMTTATLCIAIVIGGMFAGDAPLRVAAWLLAMAFFFVAQVRIMLRRRSGTVPRTVSPRGPRLAERTAAVLGLIWGAVPVLFYPVADVREQFVLGGIAIGMMCCGAFVLAAIPRAAIIFAAVTATLNMAGLLTGSATTMLPALAMLAIFLAIIGTSVVTLGRQAAQHVIDQHLIAEAALQQTQLRNAMKTREARAAAMVRSRLQAAEAAEGRRQLR
jgi:hypothetical protein